MHQTRQTSPTSPDLPQSNYTKWEAMTVMMSISLNIHEHAPNPQINILITVRTCFKRAAMLRMGFTIAASATFCLVS